MEKETGGRTLHVRNTSKQSQTWSARKVPMEERAQRNNYRENSNHNRESRARERAHFREHVMGGNPTHYRIQKCIDNMI